MKRAVVLGGGVAGIAAAFALRDRGLSVELCESRGWLGGRAFSIPNRGDLDGHVDNGPHVILGCYDHFRRVLRRIGQDDGFERAPSLRLDYADTQGRRSRLSLSRLPAPIALPFAMLRLGGLTLGERFRVLRALATIPFGQGGCATLAEWIERRGQSGAPRSFVWDPMCRSIMNAEAEDVSAALFFATLRRAFFGSARRAAIRVPRRPWSELLGEPARAQCEREGITVHAGTRVTRFVTDPSRIVELEFGQQVRPIDDDTVVFSALPWHALAALTGEAVELDGAPIVSVYFELGAEAGMPDEAVIALVDGYPFHFYCRTEGAPSGTFALLSGGCRDLDGMKTDAIETLARDQLRHHFPDARVDGGRARVVKENRATFVGGPGSDAHRLTPGRHPHIENLYICGDWTAVGLPSTLEGAAQSGHLAVADFR